jgi:uncharacterized protein (TIGR02266 family)
MVDYSNVPRDSRRVPIEARVQFKFDRFTGFISEYSSNVSPGGMFIRTHKPEPPGSILDFEFSLGDGFQLIQGRGEVVWNRTKDEGPARPAGMGIRFLKLSEGSTELIYRIVDTYIQEGGTPFDLSMIPPDPVPAAPDGRQAGPSVEPPPFELEDLESPPFPELAETPPRPFPRPQASAAAERGGPASPPGSFAPEPFPDLAGWSPAARAAEPAPYLPEVPSAREEPPPLVHYAGIARAPEQRRKFPVLLLTAVVLAALVIVLFLLRGRVMEWVGLGGPDETSAAEVPFGQAGPAPGTERPAAGPPLGEPTAPAVDDPEQAALGATPEPTAAPEASAVAAESAPPPVPAGPPASAIERITWEQTAGGTQVVLWGNGAISPAAYSHLRLGGNPPREVFKLSGMSRSHPSSRLVAGTRELLQVRTGYHPKPGGGELHVVLDLAGPGVEVAQVQEDFAADQGRLKILLRSR